MKIQDQLTNMFIYMTEQFDLINAKLELKADKSDVEALKNAIDGLYNKYDRHDTELAALMATNQRLDAIIESHEIRLGKLEQSPIH